jgi:hypothetical protein
MERNWGQNKFYIIDFRKARGNYKETLLWLLIGKGKGKVVSMLN